MSKADLKSFSLETRKNRKCSEFPTPSIEKPRTVVENQFLFIPKKCRVQIQGPTAETVQARLDCGDVSTWGRCGGRKFEGLICWNGDMPVNDNVGVLGVLGILFP